METAIQSVQMKKDTEDLKKDLNLHEIAQRHDWREVLKDIVKKEDMDPWDIDVSKLVEEFIQTIREATKMEYRIPANAILASSILLRKKSDSWILREGDEQQDSIWDDIPITPDQIPLPREKIPEPTPKKRVTKRKVSLDELIEAVDDVITQEKNKARRKAKENRTPVQNIIPKRMLEMAKADGEDFEERIKEVREKIHSVMDNENLTRFTEIVEENTRAEIINTILPVLHLANKGDISIWQEEIFGDIFIHYIGENN